MTALPPKAELDGSSSGHNQGVFKTAIGAVRDYLSGLFGTDGTQASALSALKVLDPQAVYNLSPVFTVGSNALTCTIKDRAGNDLSSTNPAFVGQRSATASDGGFNLRAMTANVALTISSGSTLGHANGVAGKLYWYLLDNAGAQVLAVSGSFQGFSGIYSTTAEGGAGAADSGSVVYATAAHSNLPGRLIAVTTDTQTTAGTWAATPSLVSVNPIPASPEAIGALPLTGGTMAGPIVLPAFPPSGMQAASAYAAFRKNIIIGGNFTTNPWQRGTSFTAPANATYSADRFIHAHTTDGVVNVLKTADSPTASEAGVYSAHCLHIDVTTADVSIGATQVEDVRQYVEGLNIAHMGFGQAGTRYLTLSFWHKHTKIGTYCVSFINSANNRSYVAEYTQDVSDTWEKATITIPVDTSGTWLYDTGIGLRINWSFACGSTYQTTAGSWQAGQYLATANQVNGMDSTSNNFKLALIQLEAGTVATEFESLQEAQVLTLCQRYYVELPSGAANSFILPGGQQTGTNTLCTYFYPVEMRTTPTTTIAGAAANYYVIINSTTVGCSSLPSVTGMNSPKGCSISFPAVASVGFASWGGAADATAKISFSAEL